MIGKRGAMKKGFFLMEALLSCVLISLLAGSIVHYNAQWSLSHKKCIDKSKAVQFITAYLEQEREYVSTDGYTIIAKKISIPAPVSSDRDQYPGWECTEITIASGTDTMSVIAGDRHAK